MIIIMPLIKDFSFSNRIIHFRYFIEDKNLDDVSIYLKPMSS
jgi:hypothetical protein